MFDAQTYKSSLRNCFEILERYVRYSNRPQNFIVFRKLIRLRLHANKSHVVRNMIIREKVFRPFFSHPSGRQTSRNPRDCSFFAINQQTSCVLAGFAIVLKKKKKVSINKWKARRDFYYDCENNRRGRCVWRIFVTHSSLIIRRVFNYRTSFFREIATKNVRADSFSTYRGSEPRDESCCSNLEIFFESCGFYRYA